MTDLELYAYMRTSSPKKDVQKEELIKQQVGIDNYKDKHGIKIIEYVTEGMSGKMRERPRRAYILKNLKKGNGHGVIVDTMARWGRDLADTVLKVEEVAVTLEKIFIDAKMGFRYEPDNPASEIFMKQLAFFADIERIFLVERLQSGREVYVAAGGKLGRDLVEVPKSIRNRITDLYINKELGMGTIAKVVSPFEITVKDPKSRKPKKEEIFISKTIIRRVLEEENIEIRPPKGRG